VAEGSGASPDPPFSFPYVYEARKNAKTAWFGDETARFWVGGMGYWVNRAMGREAEPHHARHQRLLSGKKKILNRFVRL